MPKYTVEKNAEMLVALLKKYNIKKIIVSPGAMNISFVGSVQNDNFFELYSCVDERSACYMACGLAEESQEPVVLTCTGATASRNYLSGLTEAYYRKLPIIAVTSAQFHGNLGNNIPQAIDRFAQLNDIVKTSVQVFSINTPNDEWDCNVKINKALLEVNHNGLGPVHINLETVGGIDFVEKELPEVRKINRYNINDTLPKITKDKIAIFIGSHSIIDKELEKEIDEFCDKYNAIVLHDWTSNYHGKYGIMPNIVLDQRDYKFEHSDFDLIIHLGNISGAYLNLSTNSVWRVNEDGKIIDTFRKLENVYEMKEIDFFKNYNKKKTSAINSTHKEWKKETNRLYKLFDKDKIPFSNLWIANQLVDKIPKHSYLHLGILNTLRSWNYFQPSNNIDAYSNTGGFGIDGIPSTIIGSSLVNKNRTYYGILGDLAFFYDMNALGNRYVGNNIRLLIINNECGTEFHNYSHAAQALKEDVGKFVAADGHFGNKSDVLVKNYAENLGYKYLSASNKDEFDKNVSKFISNSNKSIIFEVFTNSKDESDALEYIRGLAVDYIRSNQQEEKKEPKKSKNKITDYTKKVIKKIIKK